MGPMVCPAAGAVAVSDVMEEEEARDRDGDTCSGAPRAALVVAVGMDTRVVEADRGLDEAGARVSRRPGTAGATALLGIAAAFSLAVPRKADRSVAPRGAGAAGAADPRDKRRLASMWVALVWGGLHVTDSGRGYAYGGPYYLYIMSRVWLVGG